MEEFSKGEGEEAASTPPALPLPNVIHILKCYRTLIEISEKPFYISVSDGCLRKSKLNICRSLYWLCTNIIK